MCSTQSHSRSYGQGATFSDCWHLAFWWVYYDLDQRTDTGPWYRSNDRYGLGPGSGPPEKLTISASAAFASAALVPLLETQNERSIAETGVKSQLDYSIRKGYEQIEASAQNQQIESEFLASLAGFTLLSGCRWREKGR